MTQVKSPKIFAHRGANLQAPENSQLAFELALKQQADGLECDIQLSSDGVPVLWHDDSLQRIGLDNKGTKHLKWEELQLLNISPLQANDSQYFTGLLSLEDFLCRFSHKTQLTLEIKNYDNEIASKNNYNTSRILEIIKNTTLPELHQNYNISSFDFETLISAHKNSPQFNYIANIDQLNNPQEISRIYKKMPFLHGICVQLKVLSPELCTMAREFDLLIITYTCNDESELQKALKCDVDIIISDCPGKIRFLLD